MPTFLKDYTPDVSILDEARSCCSRHWYLRCADARSGFGQRLVHGFADRQTETVDGQSISVHRSQALAMRQVLPSNLLFSFFHCYCFNKELFNSVRLSCQSACFGIKNVRFKSVSLNCMVAIALQVTLIKVSVSPPKKSPIYRILRGLSVYFCVDRRCRVCIMVESINSIFPGRAY